LVWRISSARVHVGCDACARVSVTRAVTASARASWRARPSVEPSPRVSATRDASEPGSADPARRLRAPFRAAASKSIRRTACHHAWLPLRSSECSVSPAGLAPTRSCSGITPPAGLKDILRCVGSLLGQWEDLASAQEPPQLDLGGGAADLGDDGAGTTGMSPALSRIRWSGPDSANVAARRPPGRAPRKRPVSSGPALGGNTGAASSSSPVSRPVLGFPRSDHRQGGADPQSPPGGCGHPRRDADALGHRTAVRPLPGAYVIRRAPVAAPFR
jgi:hypothetical protein